MHSNIVEPKNSLPIIVERQGVTKVNGHVIVNKTYQLPHTINLVKIKKPDIN